MFSYFKKGVLKKYTEIKDEGVHIILSLLVASVGFLFDIEIINIIIIFILGMLIDIDHFFNPLISKLMHLSKKNAY